MVFKALPSPGPSQGLNLTDPSKAQNNLDRYFIDEDMEALALSNLPSLVWLKERAG